jgi:hypothetical protein
MKNSRALTRLSLPAFPETVWPGPGVTVGGMLRIGRDVIDRVHQARRRFVCGGREMALHCVDPAKASRE